ncbi:hypothetical protein BBAD15_g12491 [Beauveria bassiana D1-5]|uniref:Uncharacterized protein n=1 Tax=Beauveria bassiana D1-5 TaxID=1245745 RepID=A0A0A2V872_BEABA|nr:hypothetical protein BBAD15_g12491 [Beauveria bassiana D1-5]
MLPLELPDPVLRADAAAVAVDLVQDRVGDGGAVFGHPAAVRARRARQVVVQVAVAEMAEDEGADVRVQRAHAGFGRHHEIGNALDRQRHIVLQVRAVGALRFGDFLAQLP